MGELDQRVVQAQNDSVEADSLLREYLPMIKKQVMEPISRGAEYEDILSTGMLAFAGAIQQYRPERGSFISFARLCIRSRILDEVRREGKNAAEISLDGNFEGQFRVETDASLTQYSREQERQTLSEEISALRQALAEYGIPFDSLAKISPKQKRSRALCITAARRVADCDEMRETFVQSAKLAQTELAHILGVSPKTIEQHRRYIVTLVVILLGDYPCIRAFLPNAGEVKA